MAKKKKNEEETALVASKGGATSGSFNYAVKLQNMTPEEKGKYLALTEKINPHDLSTIHEYGSELSQVVAQNGERLLSSVRSDTGGEIVELVTDLLKQLNMINIDDINSDKKFKKFLAKVPILKKFITSIDNVKVKYNDVSTNVSAISKKMSDAKLVAMKDNSTLQEIFDNNVIYIDRIRELIMGAKVLLEKSKGELDNMIAHQDEYEAYEVSEMQDFINQLEKRVADMQVTEQTLQQNLLQIKATQGNNIAIAQKSDNITTNVLPLWKNQLAIALVINNQTENVKAQQMLTETTNQILTENAKKLHTNSVAVAKANEEAVISLATLKTTTNELISTIKEVQQIHIDGAKDREELEAELQKLALQLEDAIQMSNNK